nr:hypothetical protein [Sphingomonas sp.]
MRAFKCIVLFVCTALGACNMTMSGKPLFGQRSSSVILQDGLWTRPDAKCAADLSQPKEKWPKCAGWMLLKDSKVVAGSDMKPDEGAQDVFIVDGKPVLVQAVIKMSGPERSESFYGYFILEPKARSSEGRVTAIEFWPVSCGTTKQDGSVSPYPGFDKDCMTTSVPALRAAAEKPRDADVEPMSLKWVRAETP